ncbi:MAG: GMC family oxidoreductase [Defluviicoccus sp.]
MIIGGGIAGALVAHELVAAGLEVVVLEAGADQSGSGADGWDTYLDHYFENPVKTPNSPYPHNIAAPSPDVLDVGRPTSEGYFYQRGPNPFRSDYVRVLGGTTLHWLGTSLRFTPACFELASRYSQAVDWPLKYEDLAPWYERAEWTIGVAGEASDQRFLGISFGEGYNYPMERIPSSWLDQRLKTWLDGAAYAVDDETIPLQVTNTPVGRNGIPRAGGAIVAGERRAAWDPAGGSPDLAWRGQRCKGYSNCIPICPVQAKYSSLKTLNEAARAHPQRLSIRTQSVVTGLETDGDDGTISAVRYKRYAAPNRPDFEERRIAGRIVVLAANAIENAKIGLASGLRDASGQLGRNFMDHPLVLSWGLAPQPVGGFMGPGSTGGIENFRDGGFRRRQAGFRIEIGNWGWALAEGAPVADVIRHVRVNRLRGTALRTRLADEVPRQLRLGALIEQLPLPENRISIRPDIVDALGEPRPVIDYRIDDYAFQGMALARNAMRHVFDVSGIEDHTHDDRTDPGWVERNGEGFVYCGAGHLAGTHRMGATAAGGVTDSAGRAFGHPNLWMVGAGAMPTIGTCNPTLTLAALTLFAASDIIKKISSLP